MFSFLHRAGSLPDCPYSKCLSALHQRIGHRTHGVLLGSLHRHLWPMPQQPRKGSPIVSIPNIFSVCSSFICLVIPIDHIAPLVRSDIHPVHVISPQAEQLPVLVNHLGGDAAGLSVCFHNCLRFSLFLPSGWGGLPSAPTGLYRNLCPSIGSTTCRVRY